VNLVISTLVINGLEMPTSERYRRMGR